MKEYTREKLILMAAHIALNNATSFMMDHEKLGPEDLTEILNMAIVMHADLISTLSIKRGRC